MPQMLEQKRRLLVADQQSHHSHGLIASSMAIEALKLHQDSTEIQSLVDQAIRSRLS